jgi:hypothetical protein
MQLWLRRAAERVLQPPRATRSARASWLTSSTRCKLRAWAWVVSSAVVQPTAAAEPYAHAKAKATVARRSQRSASSDGVDAARVSEERCPSPAGEEAATTTVRATHADASFELPAAPSCPPARRG